MFKCIMFAAALLSAAVSHAQRYNLTGSVRDDQRNEVLAGATVQLQNTKFSTVTNGQGRFTIDNLTAGTYTVVVRFLGYVQKSETVTIDRDLTLDILMEVSSHMTEEVVVYATRANEKTPTTFTAVSKEAIQKQNFGQDVPMLLNWTPSIVTTSDAGAGIGYTGLRIRGSDASRINVTINGIALNDSESQGVFWVNTPDIASSVQSIQIQRGVGTSTNGPGAFGGTVNVQTDRLTDDAYAEGIASYGSFNSQRYTFKGGTGLIKDRWGFDARVSKITSDGYIKRATSDLNSYYLSGGYYGEKTIVKAIMFGGHEQTYQAWNGLDAETMATDRRFNYSGAIYDDEGNILRYYDREVDDYRQDHYQLHVSQQLSDYWNATVALHYTYGRGYFEQYKQGESFADLGLPNATIGNEIIESSDVIVRRWLDNDYYGATFSAMYSKGKTDFTVGGAASRYDNARHFGEILWAEIATNAPLRHVYYDGESQKTDFNLYAKWNYAFTEKLNFFVDVQYRGVRYQTAGLDNDQSLYDFKDSFDFFNPKLGVSYSLDDNSLLYASYAVANREPNRTDYLDGTSKPKHEQLKNVEVGWRKTTATYGLEANYYLMSYTDQLVPTGAQNDVGAMIRENIGKSYRTGIELSGVVNFSEKISWNANVASSINKNLDFVVLDETNNPTRKNTTIILSPSWIVGSQFTWKPVQNFQTSLLSKYVGKQYLDNTQNENVTLDPYFINDIRLSYQFHLKALEVVELGVLINNIFDIDYASNGYGYDGTPYFYPQAGTNFMAMISVKL